MNAARCGDSPIEALTAPAFNSELQRLSAELAVKPIDARELRPPKVLGAAKQEPYWQTSEAQRLYEQWLQLRGREKAIVPLQTRMATAWRNQAERFLASLEQWAGTRETERDDVYQKGTLFTPLIEFMPPSPLRSHAVRAFVEFMPHADGDRSQRALWFALLNRFLESARGPDRRELLSALENSRHAVLSLYAQLERQLPAQKTNARPGL